MDIIEVKKLNFGGISGKDIFNINAPFVVGDKYCILGRVESREEEDSSVSMFFCYSRDKKTWLLNKSYPIFNLQDPFIAKFRDYILLGGVEVAQRPNKKDLSYRTLFFRGEDVNTMNLFAHGPWGMKCIRFIELHDKTIAVFTRPQGKKGGRGKIGFTIIDTLKNLTPRTLSNVPLINNMFTRGEWGGVNELQLLENGKVGVLGHIGKFIKDKKHYSVITFIFDPKTGIYSDMKIILKRADLPHVTPKREDLYNVVYPGGLIRNSDGTANIYVGVGDTKSYEIVLKDPFFPNPLAQPTVRVFNGKR